MLRRYGPAAALLVVVLGLVWALGAARPLPPRSISGDRLGPESGESVAVYLAAASERLRRVPGDQARWALVSPVTEWTTAQTWDRLAAARRIGRVLMRVPIPGVHTPTVTVTPGQSAAGLAAAGSIAAWSVPDAVAPGERGRAIARVCRSRLLSGTASVVGAVVLGTGAQLRSIAAQPGVRGVQPVPDDAGFFAVAPLLPRFTERALPGPDSAPVPAA